MPWLFFTALMVMVAPSAKLTRSGESISISNLVISRSCSCCGPVLSKATAAVPSLNLKIWSSPFAEMDMAGSNSAFEN
jgi:hypothetical protein